MCGIGGIMYKLDSSKDMFPVGSDLVKMLESMTHRGRDSSGVTVSGVRLEGDLVIRIWTSGQTRTLDILEKCTQAIEFLGGVVKSQSSYESFVRLVLDYQGEIKALGEAMLDIDGVDLHSIGYSSEVLKDVGTPMKMDSRHNISRMNGTHGIGHVRMATESQVDINHAHPFWAYPFADVTVVHNGQLTNYHKLKRFYEDFGHHFQTHNDSELIAVYIADKLSQGQMLDDVLSTSLEELDGTFTYLVSTQQGIGYAKDKWAAKPLVSMETDSVVAIASEEIALESVFSKPISRLEPQESEVKTWLY